MKTAKEFYETHHPIDVGVETKGGCIQMMQKYSEHVNGLLSSALSGALDGFEMDTTSDVIERSIVIDVLKEIKKYLNHPHKGINREKNGNT